MEGQYRVTELLDSLAVASRLRMSREGRYNEELGIQDSLFVRASMNESVEVSVRR